MSPARCERAYVPRLPREHREPDVDLPSKVVGVVRAARHRVRPPPRGHAARGAPRRSSALPAEAAHEESVARADDVTVQHGCRKRRQPQQVFSTTASAWCPGTVLAVTSRKGQDFVKVPGRRRPCRQMGSGFPVCTLCYEDA